MRITTENNVFPNPFDPARNVLFGFDWWHGLKRLRAHTLDNNLVFKNEKRASKLDFEAVKYDILEISDIDDIELIHFESDLIDDPELESHYFEK